MANVTEVIGEWMRSEAVIHKAYFRLFDDWAKLYIDSIRIRERMRKKQIQVEYGLNEVVYLGEKIPFWKRVEISFSDMLARAYFEGIGKFQEVWCVG